MWYMAPGQSTMPDIRLGPTKDTTPGVAQLLEDVVGVPTDMSVVQATI